MRSGTMVLVGATVLLVAASVVFVLLGGEPEERGAAAVIDAPSGDARGMQAPGGRAGDDSNRDDVRSLAVPSALSTDGASREALETAAATPTRLTGRVTHALDGRAAVGERLTILWEPADPEAERLAHPEAAGATPTRSELRDALQTLGAGAFETVTDDDGRYAFTVPDVVKSAVRLSGIDVAAGPTTPRQMIREERELAPGTEAVFDFTVHAGSTLVGTVVDVRGRPVAGAQVHGWTDVRPGMRPRVDEDPDQTVRTDGSGAFTIGYLGEQATLAASADGMAAHVRLNGTFPVGEVTDGLRLVLSEAREVVGMVIGGDGDPIPDVSITLSSELPTSQRVTQNEGVFGIGPLARTVVSGQAGRFRIEGLCQRTYRARAKHEGHREWNGTQEPDDTELLIQLTAGLRLTGTVSAPGGVPLPGARVRLGSGDDMSNNVGFTDTDEDGRFVFEGLSRDVGGFVVARAEGHAVHAEQPIVIEEDTHNHVDLVLRRERVLAGVVVDAEGAPIEGVTLSVVGDRLIDYGNVTMFPAPTWESQFGAVWARSDATGAFRIGNLYDGRFRLSALSPDESTRAALDVQSGREDLRIVLDPDATVGVTLVGVARDGVTGLPLQDQFFVTPMLAGSGGGFSGTSHDFEDPEGRYRITALEEGTVLLNASADGYAPWSGGAHTLENGEHRFDIAFLSTRRVTFRVVDADGAPVIVNLNFKDEQEQSLMVEHGPGSRMSSLSTNEQGEAIAGGLPASRITVTAKRGWLGTTREYAVDLRPEPRGPIELVYGEPEVRTLLVLVLTGAPTEPEPIGEPGWKIGRWLETQVKEGHLRPVAVPVQIVATDNSGTQVASTTLDPSGENAQAFPIEGVNVPFVAKLELPTRPLKIRSTAEGHATSTRTWDPDAIVEIMVVVLRPE